MAPKSAKFGEITQNNGMYTVQGHSRSPISVPVESQLPKQGLICQGKALCEV